MSYLLIHRSFVGLRHLAFTLHFIEYEECVCVCVHKVWFVFSRLILFNRQIP